MQTSEINRERFAELVDAHQGILYRICFLYGRGEEEQRDLFQEIVLQLWRSIAAFRGQSSFTTWMYRVALNTALLERRKATRRRDVPHSGELEVGNISVQTQVPDEDVQLLRACIQELPSLDRAIVLLHLEERSYDEISEITGLSRGNVSVRLVRLKRRLRGMLEQKGVGKDGFQ